MDSESGKGLRSDITEFIRNPRVYGPFLFAILTTACGSDVEHVRQSLEHELSGADLKPGASITMKDPGFGNRQNTGDKCSIGRGSQAHVNGIDSNGLLRIKEWKSKNPCIVKAFPPGSVEVIRR